MKFFEESIQLEPNHEKSWIDLITLLQKNNELIKSQLYVKKSLEVNGDCIQLWKKSASIKDLALNARIQDTLELLYGKKPFPFSTINFLKGSEQPMHSDSIHFHCVPNLWMAGVWVALEDVDDEIDMMN